MKGHRYKIQSWITKVNRPDHLPKLIPIILLLVASCHRSIKTEFFPLQKEAFDHVGQRVEYIVIANPPPDQAALEKLLIAYSDTTLNMVAAEKKYKNFTRYFFKESNNTPRDFRNKSGYLSEDQIGNHIGDIIAYLKWEGCKSNPQRIN